MTPAEAIDADRTRWIGLKIKRHEAIDAEHALVEFIAKYKIAGRAYALHETSRFVRENGHWFYLDGKIE
jgi:SEC-C motif-containing protein